MMLRVACDLLSCVSKRRQSLQLAASCNLVPYKPVLKPLLHFHYVLVAGFMFRWHHLQLYRLR
jgi:hypothetical protein